MNTNMFLDNGNSKFPDRIAICSDDYELTYAQLYDQVGRITAALKSMGCTTGSRVAFIAKNSAEAIVLYYAVSRLGAIFAPLDPYARVPGLSGTVHSVQPDLLFIDEDFIHLIAHFRERAPRLTHIVTMGQKHSGLTCFSDLLGSYEPIDHRFETNGDDPNVIMFTGGVVDKPKAVVLSHNCFISLVRYKLTSTRIPFHGPVLLCVPICHIIGLAALMSPIYSGRTLVLMRHLLPDDWLVLVSEMQLTTVFLQPHFLARLIRSPLLKLLDISSLRIIHIGGDIVPAALLTEAMEVLPDQVELRCVYGLTEATFDTAVLVPWEDCRNVDAAVEKRRLNSIGRPLPDTEIRILDNNGLDVPEGATGVLWVRTPRAMLGYINRESLEFIPRTGDWIETGDLGYRDAEGFYYLTGERTHGSYRIDEEVSNRIIVYPAILPYSGAINPESGDLAADSLDAAALAALVMSAHQLHAGLDFDALKRTYLETVPRFLKAYAYGIQLWNPKQEGRIIGTRKPNHVQWWAPGSGQFEGSLLVLSENSVDHAAYVYSDNVSCREFARLASPEIWAFIPLYDSQQNSVGILAFARGEQEPSFTATDRYVMRIIANHICVAAVNAIRYGELSQQYMLAAESLRAARIITVLSNADGSPVHVQDMENRLPANAGQSAYLNNVINNNIQCIATGTQDSCAKTVVFAGESPQWYKVHTSRLGEEQTMLYLSTITLNDATASFEAVRDLLNDRELEVLEGISKGLSYDEIAQKLFISGNTVKYHLRKMYQKLNVTSKPELLIKAYGLQIEDGLLDD